MIDLNKLLYIEPKNRAVKDPIIDSLTRKMTYALRHPKDWDCTFGFYQDVCGCKSNLMYFLQNGMETNELAIHYVAFHRDEIPEEQLDIINSFNGEEVPILYELWPNYEQILMTKEEQLIYEKIKNKLNAIMKAKYKND